MVIPSWELQWEEDRNRHVRMRVPYRLDHFGEPDPLHLMYAAQEEVLACIWEALEVRGSPEPDPDLEEWKGWTRADLEVRIERTEPALGDWRFAMIVVRGHPLALLEVTNGSVIVGGPNVREEV